MPSEVSSPGVHPLCHQLWLAARPGEARRADTRVAIEEHDARVAHAGTRQRSSDEGRPCLTVEDGNIRSVPVGGEAFDPMSRGVRLPAFPSAEVSLHDLGWRNVDRVQVMALHSREGAGVQRLHRRRLAGARRSDHEE